MSNDLEQIVNEMYKTPSDINEHIPTLLKYGQECEHITEMGVRWIVSTWAFLGAAPKKLISYDIKNPSHWGKNINHVYTVAKEYGLDFTFVEADVLKIDIEPTDLLFIDTWHIYDQLKQELTLHGNKAKKYIIMHDTTTFGEQGERKPYKGLWPAIEEFLEDNKGVWALKERFTNNNGLTILQRIQE